VNSTGKEPCFLLLTHQDGAKASAGALVMLQNSISSKKVSNSWAPENFKKPRFFKGSVVIYVHSSSANEKDVTAANLETLYACLGVCGGSKALKRE